MCLAFCFHAAHRAARTVDGAVERVLGFFILDTFENDRGFAHGAADETLLAGKCRRCSLANYPIVLAAMSFSPGKIVMVMDFLEDRGVQKLCDFAANPISSGARVDAAEMHALDVLIAEIAICIDHAGINVHAIFGAGFLEKPGGDLVAQSTRAEMDANPDAILFVRE